MADLSTNLVFESANAGGDSRSTQFSLLMFMDKYWVGYDTQFVAIKKYHIYRFQISIRNFYGKKLCP